MAEEEVAVLRSEIARLNKIIGILLEQNEAQKARIAYAEKGNASSNLSIAHAEKSNAFSELGVAVSEKINPSPELNIAISENHKGNTELLKPISEKINASSNLSIAVSENHNGNNELLTPISEKGNASKEGWRRINATGSVATEALAPLPDLLSASPGNIAALYFVLRKQGFNRVKKEAAESAARLLLHFYNKGAGGYPELMKLTGLSRFGLGKHIRSLKKRGLIERNGWQRFRVTAHAIHLMQRADCK